MQGLHSIPIMPKNPKSALIDFYEVDDSDRPVTLKVIVSFRQNAVTTVKLNEVPVPPQPDQEHEGGSFVRSFTTELGTNRSVCDKELIMHTIVHDINDQDNRTGLTIELAGGVNQQPPIQMGPVTVDDGAIMTYSVEIGFFKRNPKP